MGNQYTPSPESLRKSEQKLHDTGFGPIQSLGDTSESEARTVAWLVFFLAIWFMLAWFSVYSVMEWFK